MIIAPSVPFDSFSGVLFILAPSARVGDATMKTFDVLVGVRAGVMAAVLPLSASRGGNILIFDSFV